MNRRGFLSAILAAGVAPAYIKADRLMRLAIPSQEIIAPEIVVVENRLLTFDMIVREAILQMKNSLNTDTYFYNNELLKAKMIAPKLIKI